MASSAPRKKNRSKSPARRQKRVSHAERIRALLRSGKRRIDPTNKRSVARQFNELQRRKTFEKHYGHDISKADAKVLKEKGFYVTKSMKRVVIDVPRDVHRQKIPHTKFSILKKMGVVKYTNTERRDFVIGFTKQEKKKWAADPKKFTADKIAEFKREYPQYAKFIKPSSIRLQHGAFQGTKQFVPDYYVRHYGLAGSMPATFKMKGKKLLDNLTGLHIVIYIPQSKQGKNARKKKGKRSKDRRA